MSMCHHPWVGLDISPQGEFKPCCKYKYAISNSFDGYKNSHVLAELRTAFLNGERPEGCYRCWYDEDSGIPSKRQMDQQYIFNNSDPDLDSIKVLSMAFGNTCNLACRICSSKTSSRWGQEAQKLKTHFPNIKIFKHEQFYKDPAFMDPIYKIVPDLIHIDIPGGEPFLTGNKEHLEFIDTIAAANPENVSLHYTTNLTVFPEDKFWQQWTRFKQVDIQLSIDGVENHFEYNRWPANWNNCFINLQKYQQKEQQNENIKLSISHSVSIFTVFYLPEFLNWCSENNLPKPWLGLITNPSHYSITVLPKNVKEVITNKFKNFPELESIISAMWAKDDSEQFDIMLKYVTILDEQRQQSFAETFNQFYNLLDK